MSIESHVQACCYEPRVLRETLVGFLFDVQVMARNPSVAL